MCGYVEDLRAPFQDSCLCAAELCPSLDKSKELDVASFK